MNNVLLASRAWHRDLIWIYQILMNIHSLVFNRISLHGCIFLGFLLHLFKIPFTCTSLVVLVLIREYSSILWPFVCNRLALFVFIQFAFKNLVQSWGVIHEISGLVNHAIMCFLVNWLIWRVFGDYWSKASIVFDLLGFYVSPYIEHIDWFGDSLCIIANNLTILGNRGSTSGMTWILSFFRRLCRTIRNH